MKKLNKKQKTILIVVLLLFLGVAATTIVFMDRIREFLPSDEGAIALQEEDSDKDGDDEKANTGTSKGDEDGEETETEEGPVIAPGFEVSDGGSVWKRQTEVEIFSISYEDGANVVTVQSDSGDNVIAPGTEQSYTFKLKNTGNVAMDYTLTVDAYVTPGDVTIPIESRINRHDGHWLSGGADEWVDIETLDGTVGNYTLGAGRYSSYTLDWRWPFESGDDEWDTYLGNLAMDGDVTYTLVIRTIAEVSTDPYNTNGILPQTGDSGNVVLYAALMGSAVLLMILLLVFHEREEDK